MIPSQCTERQAQTSERRKLKILMRDDTKCLHNYCRRPVISCSCGVDKPFERHPHGQRVRWMTKSPPVKIRINTFGVVSLNVGLLLLYTFA